MNEQTNVACIMETWINRMEGVTPAALCPPGFSILQQPQCDGQGGVIAMVYRDKILLTRCPVQQSPSFEFLHLVLGDWDRLGLPLEYQSPT